MSQMVFWRSVTAKIGFDHSPIHLWFAVANVELRQAFSRVLLLSPRSLFPPLLHIHIFFIFQRHNTFYILITNLIHWLLFIHKILFSSTCFEPQVLIFRRIQLYTCSIWYCHYLRTFVVACRFTDWVLTHSIFTHNLKNFCNVFFSSACCWPSWSLFVSNTFSTLRKTFHPLLNCCFLHNIIPVNLH